MSKVASTRNGYTLALAGRHLLTGPLRPRATMREALAAGLGEGSRIALFAAVLVLYALLNSELRSSAGFYLATIRQSPEPSDWVLGGFLSVTLLGLLVIVLYLSQSAILHAAIWIVTRARPVFARTRSVVAIANWIPVVPACVLYLAMRGLLQGTPLGSVYPLAGAMLAIIVPYATLSIAEATGSSLRRSALILLLALIGEAAASLGIDAGLEDLNAALSNFILENDPA